MPKIKRQESLILQERRIFAHNFKQARKKANITQIQLEERTGLTQAFISNVENSKKPISLDSANILAAAIGQPLWQLLTPVENK
ncbi:MAG: helix-turn-helix transcriptional regulator [Nitrosospira sp.]